MSAVSYMSATGIWPVMRVLLGVSGGIAAYKAAELVRRLRDAGAEVRVVLTENAARFVTPLTFQALSGHPVRSEPVGRSRRSGDGPYRAGALGRRSRDRAGSGRSASRASRTAWPTILLTTLCLASAAPLALAPAMNQQMWAHAATQANVATLRERGVRVLGPASGSQACGEFGAGRLLEPTNIVAELSRRARPRAARRHARAGQRRTDLRGHRPGALHRQPQFRPHGFRGRARRGRAGRASAR